MAPESSQISEDEEESDSPSMVDEHGREHKGNLEGHNEEGGGEEEEGEEDEHRLKFASLTKSQAPVYPNRDAISSFIVGGDKMVDIVQGL